MTFNVSTQIKQFSIRWLKFCSSRRGFLRLPYSKAGFSSISVTLSSAVPGWRELSTVQITVSTGKKENEKFWNGPIYVPWLQYICVITITWLPGCHTLCWSTLQCHSSSQFTNHGTSWSSLLITSLANTSSQYWMYCMMFLPVLVEIHAQMFTFELKNGLSGFFEEAGENIINK